MAGRTRRWVIIIGAFAALSALAAADSGGLRRYAELKTRVGEMRATNAALAAENDRLSREVRALQSNPAAVERAVREELRYIRPGERVYWLGEKGSPP